MSDDDRDGGGDGAADAAADGLSHLQAAALELISAGRSFLDAADRAVRDDASIGQFVDSLAGLGREVVARATTATPGDDGTDPDDADPDGPADGFEGIDIDG